MTGNMDWLLTAAKGRIISSECFMCVCFYNNVTCLSNVINKQLQPSEQQQIKATCVSRIRKHKTSVQLHTRLYNFMSCGRNFIFTDRWPEDDSNMAETCCHEIILRINININQLVLTVRRYQLAQRDAQHQNDQV